MNLLLRIALMALLVGGLSACASMDEQSARATPQTDPLNADQLYMSMVEQLASRRGVRVMWVNPPQNPDVESLAGR